MYIIDSYYIDSKVDSLNIWKKNEEYQTRRGIPYMSRPKLCVETGVASKRNGATVSETEIKKGNISSDSLKHITQE